MRTDEVFLYVNNKIYSGWKDVNITRSLEAMAGSFSLSVVESKTTENFDLFCGDQTIVKIGDDAVITGYIDDYHPSFDAGSHSITITGRDKTADLIDCSAAYKTGQWNNQNIFKIAKDLCGPFGIEVKTNLKKLPTIKKFKLQTSETVHEALDRLAKQLGVVITSTRDGSKLFITQSSQVALNITLKEGENILAGSASYSFKDRFSQYIVKPQQNQDETNIIKVGDEEDEDDYVIVSNKVKGICNDESIKRYRPKIFVSEYVLNKSEANLRAKWEAIITAGKSSDIDIEVQGWRMPNGELWDVDKLVMVDSPKLRIKKNLLITEVNYKKNENGTTTSLKLKRPDAFTTIDQVKKTKEPYLQG
jgi:prophage tail gpP-like protein